MTSHFSFKVNFLFLYLFITWSACYGKDLWRKNGINGKSKSWLN